MAMVGAFLGGPGTTIPTGYGTMELQWVTSDGQNQTVSFQVTGPETKTLQSDSNGYVYDTLLAGSYTVTPIHDGEYSGDDAKTLVVPNRSSVSATWFATRIYEQSVIFQSPGSISGASYSIKKTDGEEMASGTEWQSMMVFNLYPGDYTLEISFAGTTQSMSFQVGNSSTTISCNDMFCAVIVSYSGSDTLLGVTYNGVSVIMSGDRFFVLRTSVSRTVSFSTSSSMYSGVVSSAISSVPNTSVIASSESVTITAKATGKIVLITSSGTLTIPKSGTYSVLCVGGGGSGSDNNLGGGGGGYVSYENVSIDAGDYDITIGDSGGVTSFGTLLSASGGGRGSGSRGGSGGSGGGGGARGHGGAGSFGGGGGGGGGGSSAYSGGSGGTYGGDGGDGRRGNSSSSGQSGSVGVSASADPGAAYSTGSYGGGSGGSSGYGCGGGGGGGYGAWGGNGGNGGSRSSTSGYVHGGGGGGGGIAGGTGGTGTAGSGTIGTAGRGYGAGGRGGGSQSNTGLGGGGGGYGSTQVVSSYLGAPGCIVIRWIS